MIIKDFTDKELMSEIKLLKKDFNQNNRLNLICLIALKRELEKRRLNEIVR